MSTRDTPTSATTGEGLVKAGAGIVLAVYLIFELIADEYFVSSVTVMIAAALLILPRLAPAATSALAPMPAFMKIGGFLLAMAGIFELLGDVRFGSYDGFVSVLGAIGGYIGFVAAYLGARSIEV